MGKIVIACPQCHQQLSFTEIPGYQNMVVECPKCHCKANVSAYQSGMQSRGGQGADDMDTQLVLPPSSTVDIGQIRVLDTGEVQWLKVGQNVIGRRATTGTAHIKISNDIYIYEPSPCTD